MKVLVIEDDPEIVEAVALCFRLRWPGVELASSAEGRRGIDLAETECPDVVILDIGLPDIDGFEVLRQIRLFSDVPIIILTVKGEEIDKVRGLELGADDYVTKPFGHMELLARVKVAMKRTQSFSVKDEPDFISGNLAVNFTTREVYLGDELVKLTPTEYKILHFLIRNQGRVISQRRLMQLVWGEDYMENTDYLRTYIRRLRKKLGDAPPQQLLTERGLGYRFVSPS